jgi:peptidoglycan/xylan/chitin deacetylase (PgdA/CDA1 family)
VYPFSTYSAFYVGAKEMALTFDDAPLPGSKLMSGTEKTTLRDENEALRY